MGSPKYKALLIGGPCDGRRVEAERDYYEVAVEERPSQRYGFVDTLGDPRNYTGNRYTKHTYRAVAWTTNQNVVMRHSSIEPREALAQLIDRYPINSDD